MQKTRSKVSGRRSLSLLVAAVGSALLGQQALVHADTLVWTNTSTSTSTPPAWDGVATNWNDTTTATNPAAYTDGSDVQFNDALRAGVSTATSQVGNVTAGGGVSPASLTFTSSGGTTSFSFSDLAGNTAGITGATSLVVNAGFGGTVLLGGPNTYTGGTFINGGAVRAGNNGALGANGVTLNSGTLTLANNLTVPNNISVQAGTTDGISMNGNSALSGQITSSAGATVANTTLNLSGAFAITGINFSSSNVAAPATSFTGTVAWGTATTSVRLSAGDPNAVFDLGSTTGTLLAANASNSAIYYLGALKSTGTGTILSGPASVASGSGNINVTYLVGSLGLSTTYAGTLTTGAKGRPMLQVIGGALTLTNGSETYSTGSTNTGAATTVTGGALYLDNASGTAVGPSGVFVNGGTLGGNGFTNGAVAAAATGIVIVNQTAATGFATGGHIAPGSAGSSAGSTIGTLTLSSGLTLNDFSNLDYTLDGTTTATASNDLVSTGNLVVPVSGLVQVNFNFVNGAPAVGSTYDLINFSGTLTGDPTIWTATNVPSGESAVFSTAAGQVNVQFIAAVPEPASIALLGLAGGALLLRRRKTA